MRGQYERLNENAVCGAIWVGVQGRVLVRVGRENVGRACWGSCWSAGAQRIKIKKRIVFGANSHNYTLHKYWCQILGIRFAHIF